MLAMNRRPWYAKFRMNMLFWIKRLLIVSLTVFIIYS